MTRPEFIAYCLLVPLFIFASAGLWNARLAEMEVTQTQIGGGQ